MEEVGKGEREGKTEGGRKRANNATTLKYMYFYITIKFDILNVFCTLFIQHVKKFARKQLKK